MSRSRLLGAFSIGALVLAGWAGLAEVRAAGQFRSEAAVAALVLHCDTMDGPVVSAAKAALTTGNANLALVWVQPKDEDEVKRAFRETLEVRKLGSQARALADRNFFETLVRVHRAGEGAPYTGLKAAGTPVDPLVSAADRAVASGKADALLETLVHEVEAVVRARFGEVVRTKRYAPNDLAAGRRHVAAYVRFVHTVEGIGGAARAAHPAEGHDAPPAPHRVD